TLRPYSIHLVKFSFDRYEGTQMARNYASSVRLTDPEHGVFDRPHLIKMNDPLRHEGETFYQASFEQDEGQSATVLQIVRNPAWTLPYLSCLLVALGMMIHFGMHLHTFLNRRRAA